MISAIGTALSAVLGWFGDVLDALLTGGDTPGALYALLPLVGIGVAIALVSVVFSLIKRVTWGA